MSFRTLRAATAIAALTVFPFLTRAEAAPGAVYTASNLPSGNTVLVFDRAEDGQLVPSGEFATGGLGTGAGLGNQGGLVLDGAGERLYVVNAGDDTISAFGVGPTGLELLSVTPAGGARPVSLAVRGRLLYVVFGGDPNGIAGFRTERNGTLTTIPGSAHPLSDAAADPAQIAFGPDGDTLVVTEKATNRIATFPVGPDGSAGAATFVPAAGTTPFGFAFGLRGQLFVSEAFGGAADASAVTAYRLEDGAVRTLDASVPTTETSACWVAVSNDGRFAYAANTGSGTITGYAIAIDGRLTRLDADGVAATADAGTADLGLTGSGRYLYARNGAGHSITGYRVRADGSLESAGAIGGLPAGAFGLAAR